jgi:hypothetical protein
MTVVIQALVPGDPGKLRDAYDRTQVRARPERLAHIMAPCAEGLRVVEVWTDIDELKGFMADELPAVLATAGYPEIMTGEISFEIHEVHHTTLERMPTRA